MEVVTTVAAKVMDLLFGAAKKELGYMWNCSESVKTVEDELVKLKALKKMVEGRKNDAEEHGRDPGEDLENWMNKSDVKISEVEIFIDEEAKSKKTCCNLYHYGKKAAKINSSLQKHQQDGERFKDCVFPLLPLPREIDLYQRKDLENIYTQKFALKKIICAIEDDNTQIVGIVGLGGVGKTTLAKEVAAEMKNKFNHIEFIAISQNVDKETIIKKVEVAARKAFSGEMVLIILDDVWQELKLDEVVIPCGSRYMNCKILLTSRIRDVCKDMNAQEIISIEPLKEEEAWTLFERAVGKTNWDDKWKEVAVEIVKECGGLPLFIQAVGKTLKDKEIGRWETVLNRLQAPIHGDAKYKKEGLLQLKLSYEYLGDEVAKSCFLFCSLLPEDAIISVEMLTYYVMGLGMFDNSDNNIQDAKHMVREAVDTLISSFLLLPVKGVEEEKWFKMHDLVRDMAMLVSSEGNNKFLVQSGKGLREWQPKKDLDSYKKISLMTNKICKLPDHKLLFPQLDTLLMHDNELSIVPDEFFQHMEKLKVLDMSFNKISSLPRSLKQLTQLFMLDLSGNESLREISLLGELTCLEILQLKLTGITNIPKEIGKLTNLRLLDVNRCKDLSYVAPGVISKLIRLEELYVWLKEDGDCSFLVELSELKLVKIMHLKVSELHYIPDDFHFESLKEFRIQDERDYSYTYGFKRYLGIVKARPPFTKAIMKLIRVSEGLYFSGIKDVDDVLRDYYIEELRHVALEECHNVRSLVKISKVETIALYDMHDLEVLWDKPCQYVSFCNLAEIRIIYCDSILELFPLSVAQWLANLKELTVTDCKSMVVVISDGDEQTIGVISSLTRVSIRRLPKLESFYSGHSIIKYPSLKHLSVHACPSMKRWSNAENHMPNIKFDYQERMYDNINDYITAQVERTGMFSIKYDCRDEITEE